MWTSRVATVVRAFRACVRACLSLVCALASFASVVQGGLCVIGAYPHLLTSLIRFRYTDLDALGVIATPIKDFAC